MSGGPRRERLRAAAHRLVVAMPGVLCLRGLRAAERRPLRVLAVLAAVVVGLSPGLGKLSFSLSIPEMLERDDPRRLAADEADTGFDAAEPLTVLFSVRGEGALTRADLCKVKIWLHRAENHALFGVKRVVSPFHLRQAQLFDGGSRLFYVPLLTDPCAAEGPGIEALRGTPYDRLLVAKDETAVVTVLHLTPLRAAGRFGKFSPEGVQKIERSLAAAFPAGGRVRFELQGATGFRYYFWQGLQFDQALNLLVSAFLILLFRGLYGTWRSGVLAVATLTLTTTIVLSLMGLTGVTIDVLSNNLFLILSLAATEDMLYLCHFQSRTAGADWRAAPRRLVLPSFYTSVTTAIGFGSLCLSQMLPIRRLGFWAASGALIEWAIVCYAVPALMAKARWARGLARPEKAFMRGLVARLGRGNLPVRPVLVAGAALLLASGAGYGHLRANDSIEAVWPRGHAYERSLAQVRERFGWSATVDLLVRGADGEAIVTPLAAKVATLPSVFRVESVAGVRELALKNLPEASAWRGVAAGEIAQSSAMQRYVAPGGKLRRMIIYMKEVSLDSVEALAESVKAWCPAAVCALSGDIAVLTSLSHEVIGTLLGSFFVSLLIVSCLIALLGFALGIKPVFKLLIAAMWGPAVLFGLVPWALNGVNFITSVTCAVMVGLAGDNAIQFMFAARKRQFDQGIERCQGASFAMGLVMSLASLVYLGSAFLQPRRVGMAFAVGYLLLIIGDVFLLKALLAAGDGGSENAGALRGKGPALNGLTEV